MCNIREIIGDCDFSVPGIKKIELAAFRENLVLDKIGDFYILTTPIVWTEQRWFDNQVTSLTQELVRDKNDKYYKVSLNMGFHPMKGSSNKDLKVWADTRVMAKVTDKNDRIWLVGAERGLFLTRRVDTTGTFREGRNKYDIVFEGIGLGGFLELQAPIEPEPTDFKWKHISIHYRGNDSVKTFYIDDTGITDIEFIEVLTGNTSAITFDYVPDGSGITPGNCEDPGPTGGAMYGVPFSSVQGAVAADNLPFTLTIYFDNFISPGTEGAFLLKYRVPGIAPIIQTLTHNLSGFSVETMVAYDEKIVVLTDPLPQTELMSTTANPVWVLGLNPAEGNTPVTRTEWRAAVRVDHLSDDLGNFPLKNLTELNAAIAAVPTGTDYVIHWCLVWQNQRPSTASPFITVLGALPENPLLSYTWDYVDRDDIEYLYHIDDADNAAHRPFEEDNSWKWDGAGVPSYIRSNGAGGLDWTKDGDVIDQRTEFYAQTIFKLKDNIVMNVKPGLIFNDLGRPNCCGNGLMEGFEFLRATPAFYNSKYINITFIYWWKNPYGYNAATSSSTMIWSTKAIYDASKPIFVQVVYRGQKVKFPNNYIDTSVLDIYVNGLKQTVANGLLTTQTNMGQGAPPGATDTHQLVKKDWFGSFAPFVTSKNHKALNLGWYPSMGSVDSPWGATAVKLARTFIASSTPTSVQLRNDYNNGEATTPVSGYALFNPSFNITPDAPTVPSPIDTPTPGTIEGTNDIYAPYVMRHHTGATYEPFNL